MDKNQVIAALKKYEGRLGMHSSFKAERLPESEMGKTQISIAQRLALNHVLWMCGETRKLAEEDRIEKAMRWLGFIQGVLWAMNYSSINSLKVDNMPPGETFDENRI